MKHHQDQVAAERVLREESAAEPVAVEAAAVVGAAAGALVGAIAGAPGIAIGAILGGAAGAAAAIATECGEREKQAHEDQLDRDIGVIGGTIGDPSLEHPPPSHGLFHAATLGVGSQGFESSDGPMQNVDSAE